MIDDGTFEELMLSLKAAIGEELLDFSKGPVKEIVMPSNVSAENNGTNNQHIVEDDVEDMLKGVYIDFEGTYPMPQYLIRIIDLVIETDPCVGQLLLYI